jgi:hypothetical protein
MMGRWLSGCPLDLSPDKDDPAIVADPQRRNNFSNAGDEQGLRCPIGALRRSVAATAPHGFETRERGEAAPADSARHRVRPASPEQRVQDDGVDRGLINLFIQVVIERQFEFLQKEWMQGGEFIRLDPKRPGPDQRHRRRIFANVCPAPNSLSCSIFQRS